MKQSSLCFAEILVLECMNLNGVDRLKLSSARASFNSRRPNYGLKIVDLRRNPRSGGLLILDGTHQAIVAVEHRISLATQLWEETDNIVDALVRVNFERGIRFHDTAEMRGFGTIAQLVSIAGKIKY